MRNPHPAKGIYRKPAESTTELGMAAGVEERLSKAISQAEEVALELVRSGRLDEAMRCVFGAIREAMRPLVESVRELRESLEHERELRKSLEGDVRRLEGRIIEFGLGERLARWCADHGLKFGSLPRDLFRVDGVIEGERLLALVQIARTGTEEDVAQLLAGARIYRDRLGEEPNALVLYVYASRPSEELSSMCEEHGIIVDNSPKRIARRLAELDEALKEAR